MSIGQKVAQIALKAFGIDGLKIYLNPPQWDDLSGSLFAAKLDTASGRLEYDVFNAGVSFHDNARYPDEPVVIPIQLKHAMVVGVGSVARPHFHWLQQQPDIPNMLLAWKLTNPGGTTVFETDFSNYNLAIPTSDLYTYVSGTLLQKTIFPEIDLELAGLSASLDVVLFRDTLNTSELFGDIDPVSEDVTIKYNDSHVLFNSSGSRQEFVK
jgi:hypothetical protein